MSNNAEKPKSNRPGSTAPSMYCPHCKSRSAVRSSNTLSPLLKELYYQCKNHLCGFTWVAQLEATRALNEPITPNPEIRLPKREITQLGREITQVEKSL